MEKLRIQLFENVFEIINSPPSRTDALASAYLAYQVRLPRHVLRRDIPAITGSVLTVYRLAKHFRQQDMRDCPEHIFRGALQQVRNSHQQLSFPQPDCAIDVGEAEKFRAQVGDLGTRPKFTVGLLEHFCEAVAHFSSD